MTAKHRQNFVLARLCQMAVGGGSRNLIEIPLAHIVYTDNKLELYAHVKTLISAHFQFGEDIFNFDTDITTCAIRECLRINAIEICRHCCNDDCSHCNALQHFDNENRVSAEFVNIRARKYGKKICINPDDDNELTITDVLSRFRW